MNNSNVNPSVIVLVKADDPQAKPVLYACSKCGAVHSPRIYACREDMAHEAARKAAEDCYSCREHNVCAECGGECPKGWTACADCRAEKRFNAAAEVQDDGGPYFEFDGETFYGDIEDAAEDGVEWVSPCTVSYPHMDADNILENMLDDMHEGATIDDFCGISAFRAAVATFNKAQTTRSFWADSKRRICVAQAIEARRAETGTGSVEDESALRQDAPKEAQP